MLKDTRADVGVVVGRWQVDTLHDGHLSLLNTVNNAHDRLIIIVGLSPCKCTVNNPLDFEARKCMLQEHFPEATVAYLRDVPSDEQWSNDLDDLIEGLIGPGQSVMLYGSRDSFIRYYSGGYPTKELEQEVYISGTEIRKRLAVRPKNSADFRAGAVWAMYNQWPCPLITIDVAIFNDDNTRILLGRKKKEDKYRLIGGFVQNQEKFSETVAREAQEEAGVELRDITFIDSFPVDDWRYRGERDKITTVLHMAWIADGRPCPGDDIFELKWFDFGDHLLDVVVDNHVVLVEALLKTVVPF